MKKNSVPSCSPRTAVAYARYSSAGQRDVSIEQQLADIRNYARREGFTLVHEYADHAKSGFKNTESRSAFKAMMAAAETGTFDTLIVWKVDRFGRNREESAVFKGRLRRFGVKVIYAMEPIPEGSAGVLLEGMLEATAEWYSRQLSENVLRGLMDNARRCLYNGTRTLGYVRGPDGHYAIQPEQAAVVRNIFRLYRAGYSAASISRQLNAQGMTSINGKPFNPQSVLKVISNERYTGVYIWGQVHIPDGIPAIISKSDFEEAQQMRKKTARHYETGAVDYLLTGKAFCGHCGASMVGDSGTSKTGARHYYYSCQAHKARKGCNKKSVQKDYLEDCIIDFILDFVLSEPQIEKTISAIMDAQAKELQSSPLASMEQEYKQITKQIDNINNAIAAGVWSSTTVDKLKTLESSAETLRVSIETLRYSQAQLLDHDRVSFFLHRFVGGDRQDLLFRRFIINTFVNSVYVFDDHCHLVVNNVEGNLRVPLEALPADPSPGSDCDNSGLPTVSHPNSRITVYRLAI